MFLANTFSSLKKTIKEKSEKIHTKVKQEV